MPEFSLIIPAFNEEKYLGETLRSVKRQTFKDYEIIVIANGCTDQTVKIAKEFTQKVFDLKKKGVCLAKNFGLNKSKGKIIIFLDADTQLEKNALEIIHQEFQDPAIVFGTLKMKSELPKLRFKFFSFFKNLCLNYFYHGSNGVIICRREIAEKNPFRQDLFPLQIRDFIKKADKYGRYKFIDQALAVTSLRRYQSLGFTKIIFYWIKKRLGSKEGYKEIR